MSTVSNTSTDNSDIVQKKERRTFKQWFVKYFLEGQNLHNSNIGRMEDIDEHNWIEHVYNNHRKLIGILLPVIFVQFLYWSAFLSYSNWQVWNEKWVMSLTMIAGALFAGMTSEGGGAVAFPVMTLILGVKPWIARDFSVMVQACGMTTASMSIIIQGIAVETSAILFCSIGGIAGVITGLYTIDIHFHPHTKKIVFVSVWFSFAFALFLLNQYPKRKTFRRIHNLNIKKIIILIITGFVGGMFTSFAGNGIDICCFGVLTLVFRVSEKIATPTSVILMAFNSVITFYWRGMVMHDIDQDAYDYLAVTVPIVTIMAPVGATLASHFHRHVLAFFVYALDTAALIGALSIVPMTTKLIIICVSIIVGCFSFFYFLTWVGGKLLISYEEEKAEKSKSPPV